VRFLLLNQTFHPDVMATGQYLADLAVALIERGHSVTVVTSRRAYDDPEKQFPKQEIWRGIQIIRVGSTALGKATHWRRAVDFASFMVSCALRILFLPRHEAVVALTSPPLISFLGALISKLRRSRFYYWVMDFNPDEAIAAGWLRAGSLPARMLDWISRFSLWHATRIIVLDRFMRDRVVAKGISPNKVLVLPPWSQDTNMRFDPEARARFRKLYGLENKFVVLYSGNHSPCHPLDTLIEAASRLGEDPGIVFCFIGGGSEWRKVKEMEEKAHRTEDRGQKTEDKGRRTEDRTQKTAAPKHRNSGTPTSTINSELSTINLKCLPYQPLSELSGSLSAADLHVVLMGDPFVGLVHPCKIYNILKVGAPVLYIGPSPSHVTEIFGGGRTQNREQKTEDGEQRTERNQRIEDGTPAVRLDSNSKFEISNLNISPFGSARHGEVEKVVEVIQRIRAESPQVNRHDVVWLGKTYSTGSLLPKLIATLEEAELPTSSSTS
jgi:colanic acid biosynthesis glycosyl transferase WcaI